MHLKQDRNLRLFSDKFRHKTYLVESGRAKYVLKCFSADSFEEFRREEAAYTLLKNCPGIVRRLRAGSSNSPVSGSWIALEHVAGHYPQTVEDLHRVIRSLAALHAYKPVQQIAQSGFSVPETAQELLPKAKSESIRELVPNLSVNLLEEAAIIRPSPYLSITHGDANPHNCLVTSSDIYFVDLEKTGLSDPYFDASYAIATGLSMISASYSFTEIYELIDLYLRDFNPSNVSHRHMLWLAIPALFRLLIWRLDNAFSIDEVRVVAEALTMFTEAYCKYPLI